MKWYFSVLVFWHGQIGISLQASAPGQFWKGGADHCLTETKRLTTMPSETGKAQLDLIAKFSNCAQSHIQAERPCLFGDAFPVLS